MTHFKKSDFSASSKALSPSQRLVVAPLPEERRALALLAQRGAWCRAMGGIFVIIARPKNVSLRVGSIPASLADQLIARRWLVPKADDEGWVISDAGKQALKCQADTLSAPARQGQLEVVKSEEGSTVVINRDESALARLARMKKHDGAPLLDAAMVEAGERLAADFMRAGMMPGITMRWDATGAKGDYRAHPTELIMAARQRVEAALLFARNELAGLLMDVLAFSKGVETIERERHWPQRSGKILIALALSRLATHYGLSATAQGPASTRLRLWQAPDARPSL